MEYFYGKVKDGIKLILEAERKGYIFEPEGGTMLDVIAGLVKDDTARVRIYPFKECFLAIYYPYLSKGETTKKAYENFQKFKELAQENAVSRIDTGNIDDNATVWDIIRRVHPDIH